MKNHYKIFFFAMLFLFGKPIFAQPFHLKSIGEKKEFHLTIYFAPNGKGAFVQYQNHQEIIPLKIKKIDEDSSQVEFGQPIFTTYYWDEIVNGKVNGTYQLTEWPRNIDDMSYTRKKDNKKFKLELVENEKFDGSTKYFLHETFIEFNRFFNDQLIFKYPNKTSQKINLPSIEQPNGGRQSRIEDYNFDGYDDISFSVSDAGMGVYQYYSVFLYNPKTKKFDALAEPDFKNSNCSCLCDIQVNPKKKILSTSCRGGASWWKDEYQYENGKLKWLKSYQENQ